MWDRITRSAWKPYVAAAVIVFAAAAARLGLLGVLETRVTYVTFFPAVMIAALIGGLPAGLLAAFLSAFSVLILSGPHGQPFIQDRADWIGMVIFVLSAVLISYLSSVMHRALIRVKEVEAQARLLAERERAGEALRESEGRLQALMNALPVGVSFSDDPTCQSITGNPAQRAQFETGPEDNISASAADSAAPGRKVRYFKEGQELSDFDLPLQRAVSENREIAPMELEVLLPSGRRWFSEASAAPIRGLNGKVLGGVAVTLDITERKQMDDELRRNEQQFKLLSETAGNLLASENPQGIVNELCRNVMAHLDCHCFFNFLVEESVGKLRLNACAGIPEQEAAKIEWLDYGVAVCGCVARDGQRIVAEDIFNTPDIRTDLVKSYGIQAYACHPLMAQGKLIGTLSFGTRTRTHFSPDDLALMRTVTDQVAVAMQRIRLIDELRQSRHKLELRVQERTAELETYMAKLKESNQALQEFVSIASHDLQEPLRKVGTFGGMLEQRFSGVLGEQGKGYLDRMLDANRRMNLLLKALLEYSRLTSRAGAFTEVDLAKIVREVLSDLEVRLKETGGKVQVGDLPVIHADPTQMRQLFQNLIGNALKFHKEGEKPAVKVGSTVVRDKLQIEVDDNGIGFEEQYLDRIFAPFQRLHGRSEYEGTGMGLAICKKIVERHGGTIRAESVPGKGSTFIISLPAKQTRSGNINAGQII